MIIIMDSCPTCDNDQVNHISYMSMEGGRISHHNFFQLVGLAPNNPDVCIKLVIVEHLVKVYTKFKDDEDM